MAIIWFFYSSCVLLQMIRFGTIIYVSFFHSCVGIVLLFLVCPKLNHEPSSPQPVGLHVPSAAHSFCHGTRWYSVQIYVQSE